MSDSDTNFETGRPAVASGSAQEGRSDAGSITGLRPAGSLPGRSRQLLLEISGRIRRTVPDQGGRQLQQAIFVAFLGGICYTSTRVTSGFEIRMKGETKKRNQKRNRVIIFALKIVKTRYKQLSYKNAIRADDYWISDDFI